MTRTPVLPDGWTLVALDSVGSTNDEAKRRADRRQNQSVLERCETRRQIQKLGKCESGLIATLGRALAKSEDENGNKGQNQKDE